ncbi:MAG: hypothetical protein K2K77_08405 [Duncaniella sp.]|nr:hypothetical protein [Duncaniella sp.]
MKRFILSILTLSALVCAVPARAQLYEIANQLPSLLSPALSGGVNYKGFVELSGTAGVGENRVNFVGLSTSQGFKYSSWFYMGAGIGVEAAMSQGTDPRPIEPRSAQYGFFNGPQYANSSTTRVMVPVFSDFRFDLGNQSSMSAFLDLKLGAAWIMGSRYLRVQDGYVSNGAQFYLKPTIGVRIPVSQRTSRTAFSIGVSYQLLTSDNNYYWNSGSATLNNFGVTLSYEW